MARFRIVPEESEVDVEMSTSLHPTHTTAVGLEGWLDAEVGSDGRLDLRTAPHARLELPVDVLSSGNELYDREMRRRVDAHRYPTIKGELGEIRELDSTGAYAVRGTLTFHGVTNEYEREMQIALEGRDIRLEGQHVFDVGDFGVQPPKILMLKVHPEIAVRVRIVARHED